MGRPREDEDVDADDGVGEEEEDDAAGLRLALSLLASVISLDKGIGGRIAGTNVLRSSPTPPPPPPPSSREAGADAADLVEAVVVKPFAPHLYNGATTPTPRASIL